MIVLLGLLTNLDGAEQAGGVRASEPEPWEVGGGREGAVCPEGGGSGGGRGRGGLRVWGGVTLCFTLA